MGSSFVISTPINTKKYSQSPDEIAAFAITIFILTVTLNSVSESGYRNQP